MLRRVWGIRDPQRLRHADRGGLRRPARAARLRGAAQRAARRPAAEERELHALGHAPAERRAVAYAREDVLHLLEAARGAKQRLERQRRCSGPTRSAARSRTSTTSATVETVFARLPRVNSLEPGLRAVAFALDAVARGLRDRGQAGPDRPRRRRAGRDRQAPAEGPRAPAPDPRAARGRRAAPRQGDPRRGRARPRAAADPRRGRAPAAEHPRDAALIVLAEALVRARAPSPRLAYELLAARADLQRDRHRACALGLDEPDVRTLQGWRRELVGAELLELLAGRRALLRRRRLRDRRRAGADASRQRVEHDAGDRRGRRARTSRRSVSGVRRAAFPARARAAARDPASGPSPARRGGELVGLARRTARAARGSAAAGCPGSRSTTRSSANAVEAPASGPCDSRRRASAARARASPPRRAACPPGPTRSARRRTARPPPRRRSRREINRDRQPARSASAARRGRRRPERAAAARRRRRPRASADPAAARGALAERVRAHELEEVVEREHRATAEHAARSTNSRVQAFGSSSSAESIRPAAA